MCFIQFMFQTIKCLNHLSNQAFKGSHLHFDQTHCGKIYLTFQISFHIVIFILGYGKRESCFSLTGQDQTECKRDEKDGETVLSIFTFALLIYYFTNMYLCVCVCVSVQVAFLSTWCKCRVKWKSGIKWINFEICWFQRWEGCCPLSLVKSFRTKKKRLVLCGMTQKAVTD